MKRTFIALEIPLAADVDLLWSSLREEFSPYPVRWVRPGGLHLTLAFIGASTPDMVVGTERLLEKLVGEFSSFTINLSGPGYFGKPSPKVLWIGTPDASKIAPVVKRLYAELKAAHIPFDSTPFNPHVTLGRFRAKVDAGQVDVLLSEYASFASSPIAIREVILYESILEKNALPLYQPIGRFKLS